MLRLGMLSAHIKDREVTTEEGMKFAQENKSTYVETSAKTGENVEAMFKDIAAAIIGNEARPAQENNLAAGGIYKECNENSGEFADSSRPNFE